MTAVEIFNIEEAGKDYALFKNAETSVCVKFADDPNFTKEDSAGFFRWLVGKPAALPVPIKADTNFFIAVDMWRDLSGYLKVVPFRFATSAVDIVDYSVWSKKLASCKATRHQGDVLPCAACGEYRECTTYESADSSYDICESCKKKCGLAW